MKKFVIASIWMCMLFSLQAQGVRENLGPAINDPKKYDCYPNVSPDGKTLYFARNVNGNYDIYYSEMQKDGSWSMAQPITELNNEQNNYVFYVYPDGNTLLLNGAYPDKGICKVTRTATGWTKPEYIQFEEPINQWDNHSPKLSNDGKVMILSFNRDIQVSYLKPDGKWTMPKKIEILSSSTDEFSPFLVADDRTLYFSSGGFGAAYQDIFMSKRIGDGWEEWSKPVNVGPPVNTSGWESFFVLPAKGEYAYVYSLEEGSGDLFRVKIRDEVKPDPVLVLNGKVFNKKTNQPLQAQVVIEDLSNPSNKQVVTTHPADGSYRLVLVQGKKYGVSASAEGYLAVSENMDLSNIKEYQEITKDLFLVPIEKGQSLVLNNIFFDLGKADLKPESQAELLRLRDILLEHKNLKIEIGGHTDTRGNPAANQKLSEDRAKAVYNFLIKNGVPSERLSYKGYGATKPKTNGQSEEDHAKNRRVECNIL